MTGPNSSIESGEVISLFLINPNDKKRFDRFFRLCRDHSIAWLRYLQSIGYRLPLEKLEVENAVSDLACDILGEFFKHRPGQKYCVIYDYYRRHDLAVLQQQATISRQRGSMPFGEID